MGVIMEILKEQPGISDYLDDNGICEGDIVEVEPLTGRRFKFPLLRTHYDLVSEDVAAKINESWAKLLGSQEFESFHIQIYLEKSLGRQNTAKKRYRIKVLKGAPVKLNGILVLDAFLENNDCLDIGFNRIRLARKTLVTQKIGEHAEFLEKNKTIIKSKMAILLEGETGVGKTSLARKIHENSYQRGPFIHVNISSFSESLIESELFGHVKGSFTGAIRDKEGAFREAHRGTLFIDEIDSMSTEIQTKLLLFLDDLKGRAVGGCSDYQVDLRVIFSSGAKLTSLVQKGIIRKDFFYRISSGQVYKLNSLRDEAQLISDFCRRYAFEEGIRVSEKLIEFYKSLPWPGNYRELKGHLMRKKILSRSGKLDFDEVDESLIEQSSELNDISSNNDSYSLEEIKKAYIQKVFYQCDKNYTAASKKLQISTRSIRNVINKGVSL